MHTYVNIVRQNIYQCQQYLFTWLELRCWSSLWWIQFNAAIRITGQTAYWRYMYNFMWINYISAKNAGGPMFSDSYSWSVGNSLYQTCQISIVPDSKVHGANMGPTWVLSAPDGPNDGPKNLAIRGVQLVSPDSVNALTWACQIGIWTHTFPPSYH